jgi:hypothetical protein
MSKKNPEKDPTSIGNVLISMGLLDRETIKKLSEEFEKTRGELIGQFIVKHSDVKDDHIKLALMKQKHMRGISAVKLMDEMVELSRSANNDIQKQLNDLLLTVKDINK